jgi:preprotein translocase subunit SecE
VLLKHGKMDKTESIRFKIINFFVDIVKEMKKVTWPKKEELKESTIVVLISSLIFAVFVYLVDKIISEGLKAIF